VTITEYGDLQCPVCAQFATEVIPDLIADEVRRGRARLEFRNWVIIGPESADAAAASLAAGEQGRMWTFVELFYRNQGAENSGYVTDEFLASIAEAAGVEDLDAWESDRAPSAWEDELAAADAAALEAGFEGTPSFLVEGPGGTEAVGTATADEIGAAVDAVGE
jgi:protein-disulfide isomerase